MDSFQRFGDKFGKVKNFKSHSAFDNYKVKLEKLGFLKGGALTEKGEFASNIYSDEILLSELFATEFYKKLKGYQMLLLVACVCNEMRDRLEVYRKFKTKESEDLKKKIAEVQTLRADDRIHYIDDMTSLMYPIYQGSSVFEIMRNTSMIEGDLVRFLRQVMDRISQLKSATVDRALGDVLNDCQERILNALKDIDII